MLVPREDIKALIGDVRGDWRRMTRGLAKEATAVHDLRVAVPNLATHSLRLGPRSPLLGSTIATSRLREDYGVNVLAVTREGEAIGNPPGELAFQQEDVLFVIGPTDWEADQIT
jgi:K+/H+ antiporter YhaU regulatory subunit KhtT